MTIQAIIFDCDGVLVDSEIIYNSVEREYLSSIGLNYETSQYQDRFLGLTQEDYLFQLNLDYQNLNKGVFPVDFAETVKKECLERFNKNLISYEGLKPLLESYSGEVAVASSNSVELIHQKLHITGLFDYFDPHIYSGEEMKRGKPSPDLFLHSALKIRKNPDQCIVIEDSVNGVLAGIAAGMEVWGFIGGSHVNEDLISQLKRAGASKTFSEYSDLALEL